MTTPSVNAGDPDKELDAIEGARLWFVGYGKFLDPRYGEEQAERTTAWQRLIIDKLHTRPGHDPGKPKLLRFVSINDLVNQAIAAVRAGEKIAELVVDDHGGPMMQLFANDWLYVTSEGRRQAQYWAAAAWNDLAQPRGSNMVLHTTKFQRLKAHLHAKGSVTLLGCNVGALRITEQGPETGKPHGLAYDLPMELSAALGGVEVRGTPHASNVQGSAAADQFGCRVRSQRDQACRPVRPSLFHDGLPWR